MISKLKIDKHVPNDAKDSIRAKFFNRLSQYPNLMIIYKAIAMIMVWCGIWGLLETYVFPDDPGLRYVSVFVVGIFLLYIDDGSIDELANDIPPKYNETAWDVHPHIYQKDNKDVHGSD